MKTFWLVVVLVAALAWPAACSDSDAPDKSEAAAEIASTPARTPEQVVAETIEAIVQGDAGKFCEGVNEDGLDSMKALITQGQIQVVEAMECKSVAALMHEVASEEALESVTEIETISYTVDGGGERATVQLISGEVKLVLEDGEWQISEFPRPEPEPNPIPPLKVDTSWRVVEGSTLTISGRTLPARKKPVLKIDGQRVEVDAEGNFSHTVELKVGKQRIGLRVTARGYRWAHKVIGATRKLSEAEKAAKEEARKAEIRSSARSISFDELNKAPDKYIGESVVFRGQVFQISESDGITVILLSVTDEGYGFWTDEIMVTYAGSTPAVEDDIITVYGTAMGAESYDTVIGGTNTVPSMVADLIEMTG